MNVLQIIAAVAAGIWLPMMLFLAFRYGIGLAKSNYRAYPPSWKAVRGVVPGFILGFVFGLFSGLGAPVMYWELTEGLRKKLRNKFRPTTNVNQV